MPDTFMYNEPAYVVGYYPSGGCTLDLRAASRRLRQKHAVQFGDDQSFLQCIQLLTTEVDPGVTLEVVAPRVVVITAWHLERVRAAGLCPSALAPVQTLDQLPAAPALALRRAMRLALSRRRDAPTVASGSQ